MLTQAASRRLSMIGRVLNTPKPLLKRTSGALETLRLSSAETQVTIGDVSKAVTKPSHPEYVPVKYLEAKQSQQMLRQLRWMLQKDLLGQDMFLMGRPGPSRRRLAMQFLQLTEREVEFVALSRDTTEADLKQRREIQGGSAKYYDQSAVRAAIKGRVLILEGVEKAERNVLPVLNNLLENREMHLEDGRFLVPASRYDKLLEEHTQEELDQWRLVRVSEDFRVIALGLPVPRYPGNPLDPPLRSRFQAKFVDPATFKDVKESLGTLAPDADPGQVGQLLSCCYALLSPEAGALAIPDFPENALPALVQLMAAFPGLPLHSVLTRAYPYRSLLGQDGVRAVEELLATFSVTQPDEPPTLRVGKVEPSPSEPQRASVAVSCGKHASEVTVQCGAGDGGSPAPPFVDNPLQARLLGELVQSHLVGDVCLVGPRGCGKSATARQLAALLNYTIEPIVLYQDMTSRDLIQQRTTLANGDTVWNDSPLVTAALQGRLAVLDGLHRVHPGTLASVHRLVQDRELQLHDGRRLLRHDRYDALKSGLSMTDDQMTMSGVQRIHPSFRIVALAEPPSPGGGSAQWMTSEMLSLFLFHEMRPLSSVEEMRIITELYGKPSKSTERVIELAHNLRESEDATLRAIAGSLSTRQLLRIARRMASFSSEDPHSAVQRATLARFLPHIARQSLERMLTSMNIDKQPVSNSEMVCSVDGDTIQIGTTKAKRYPDTSAKTKVPDILFFDVPQHVNVLEGLLQDFVLGEHLLLVGNQGVGKNKLADRLLQLLNRPREYIQLHRDTTVQTLTLQPTVRDGVVVYDDSPLVTAVKLGHILVVDEADKAPTHVTCILKTLVESGEMILSDGRRIVPANDVRASKPSPNIIPIHPDFRMIVLANRPGFPFLGNDFFGALGDLFSCHSVDNPSPESEIALLMSYGPDVPQAIIRKLVKAFGELRNMADQGLVNYPYSTREVVNIVKHLQKFPDEGLTTVVSNVFDFDQHSKEMLDTLIEVLHKHGIPVGARPDSISLAQEIPLPQIRQIAQWQSISSGTALSIEERMLKSKRTVNVPHSHFPLERIEARSTIFSEMQSYWSIPLSEMAVVASLAVTKGANFTQDLLHVATLNPQIVYTMSPLKETAHYFSLQGLLGSSRYSRSALNLAALSQKHEGSILVHEGTSNSLILLDTDQKVAHVISLTSFLEQATETFSRGFGGGRDQTLWQMTPIRDTNSVILFEDGGGNIEVVDIDQMSAYSLTVPFKIRSLHPANQEVWLVQDDDGRSWTMDKAAPNDPCPSVIHQLSEEMGTDDNPMQLGQIWGCDTTGLGSTNLSRALEQKISSPNRLLASSNTLASVVVGFPELTTSEIYSWKREHGQTSKCPPLILTDIGQIIRPLKRTQIPASLQKDDREGLCGYIEVVDVLNHKMRFVPVPEPRVSSPSISYMYSNAEQPFLIGETSNSGLVTVDISGCVRLWETGLAQLERSLDEWHKLVGKGRDDLELTVDSNSGKDVSNPKHGKVDPNNDPHVGGNTWAGGTGGRDTAGLGGKGGPYRLDAGHKVHQLSDEEKEAIPDHVKKAAREMGQRAFQQRLKEIQMSTYDASLYEQFYNGVSKQIQSLRVVLSSLQAKSKERQWLRHQTSGELDDTKLIEGLTGEKTIYRRRAEAEPELGAPQMKPKRLRVVVDVSGSMYRFNGYDGRLDREMEAVVLVMEAFQGHEDKIRYDIIGHSGEGHGIEFVDAMKPPTDNKQRLDVIKTMHAHAQFCISGDHTLSATKKAIATLAEEDCDEAIVVVLSDANLERYGIPPKRFAMALTEDNRVNAYAIFIGSLGDQAARLTKQLPGGRAFVCMDLKNIPQILQQIFTASMLSAA